MKNIKSPMQEVIEKGVKVGDQVCTNEWFYAITLAEETTSVKDFVEAFIPFIDKPSALEYSPIKYSPSTGKPTKFDWKLMSWNKWDSKLPITKYGSWNMLKEISPDSPLVKIVKKRPQVYTNNNGSYILSILSAISFQDGDTPPMLKLQKVTPSKSDKEAK